MNAALTSEYGWLDNWLPLNQANYKLLQFALARAGYSENKYSILEPYCQTDKKVLEKRKAGWVQYYLNALALQVSLDTLPDIQACDLAVQYTIAQDGTRANLITALTGANNDLQFRAKEPGLAGNQIQIQYADPGANNQALNISVTGKLIRFSLATGAGGAITTTANQILNAVNTVNNVKALVTAELYLSTGAGVVTALAATNMSGGTDY